MFHDTDTPDGPASATPRLRSVSRPRRFATLVTVTALILREMGSTYGRSPGGYVWMILEPVLGITVMSLAFGLILRSPGLGVSFPIFYATGFLPFLMYNDVSRKLAQALNYSRSLLAYPRVTIIDALLARLVLGVLTQMLAGCIILAGILAIYDTQTILILPRALAAMGLAIALGVGVGVMNCFLISLFPIWQTVWGVVNRPLVLISGVIIMPEQIPLPYQDWLYWNPLVHATSLSRAAFYPNYYPDQIDPVYVMTVSMVLGLVGLLFLTRYHRDVLEK